MSIKLLPCPFCGCMPEPPKKLGGSDERVGYNFSVMIKCRCGARVRTLSRRDNAGWCNDTGQAVEELVAIWNRRTPETKP